MEAEIITTFLADLVNAMSDCVQAVADQCLARGVITRATYDRVLELWGVSKEKARVLILAVQNSTKTDGRCFDILLEILDEQLPPASKQKLLLEMRKEREDRANSYLALVPAHSQQLSTELDVPLTATSQQCLQQQSSLLGRFESSVGRLAYTSAQKNQFEGEVQSRVEEIGELKNKLELLESQLEANSVANENEISSIKSRISACETEMSDLKKSMEELKGIIEEESMQVKRGRNAIRMGTKRILDQVVQQSQQEIKRSREDFTEILKSKEQAEHEATIQRGMQEEANAKVRELEQKLAHREKEIQEMKYATTPAQNVPSAKSGQSTPSLKDLRKEIGLIASGWESIGILLDIDLDLLNRLKSDNQNVIEKCFLEMLKIWLNRVSPPPSWAAIADVVGHLGYPILKERLKNKYCNKKTLFNQLTKYADKWKEIGINLHFTQRELSDIEARLPSDGPTSFLDAMLSRWVHWHPEDDRGSNDFPSLKDLKDALRRAGLEEAADDLHL